MISRIQVLCSKRTVAHLQQHGEKRSSFIPHINLNRCFARLLVGQLTSGNLCQTPLLGDFLLSVKVKFWKLLKAPPHLTIDQSYESRDATE